MITTNAISLQDKILQEVIATTFADRTLLTIAVSFLLQSSIKHFSCLIYYWINFKMRLWQFVFFSRMNLMEQFSVFDCLFACNCFSFFRLGGGCWRGTLKKCFQYHIHCFNTFMHRLVAWFKPLKQKLLNEKQRSHGHEVFRMGNRTLDNACKLFWRIGICKKNKKQNKRLMCFMINSSLE